MSSSIRLAPLERRQFASDNYAGICPEAWQALGDSNRGHTPAYGNDPWTQVAADMIRDVFETPCEVFFTFNGTAANSLALASLCQSYHSIICSSVAHVETDECGAPEFFSNGTKLLIADHVQGKVTPGAVEEIVQRRDDIHYPRPKVLSISQSTEAGTLYSLAELAALRDVARQHKLRIHMDGARFANALVSLDVAPKQVVEHAGIDVLCFGGTKLGLPVGDAVVFFNLELADEFEYRCKQAGQLASKMRFMSAPWVGVLKDGAWLTHAAHANRCAKKLEAALRKIPQLKLLFPCEANAVFVQLTPAVQKGLCDRGWRFYTFIGAGGARFMCSWDTTDEDIEALAGDISRAVEAG